ncbi:MAG TPA: murein L,D-transpeptidase catalytic domain family protein [Cyclobacteriaceae bacterium]|nr:murein L,D-transpeptidase catalytic domain family protein [Cyclobacteriaceae bacterium]
MVDIVIERNIIFMQQLLTKAFLALAAAVFVLLTAFTVYSPAYVFVPDEELELSLYESTDFGEAEIPNKEIFERVLSAYEQLNNQKDIKPTITIIDFTKASTEKRLWTIDLKNQKLLYHTWVVHGQNTGDNYAHKFSNRHGSHQSSLGFYITGKTYVGKHGLSLKLHGLEPGINDQAEARAVVMHGADYVSERFIKRVGRLGRSHGCPAIPMELHRELIQTLADGTLLFIYYPDTNYLANSSFDLGV